MAKNLYSACAMKPEEVPMCVALEAGDYSQLYSERVNSILGTIKDDSLRERVRQTLGSFEERDGYLAQSSPYRLVSLQSLFPQGKVLVARPRLQVAKQNNPDFMSGFYVDFGLNLVGETNYRANPVQAQSLAENLQGIGIRLATPKLIPYKVLELNVDEKSPSGLVFKLSEQGKDLGKSNVLNTQDFNWNYQPSNNGLFRACLNWGGLWYVDDDDLQNSDDDGRVVIETTCEASAKNFVSLQEQATELFERQRRERHDLAVKLRA